ncbi:PIN domain-containing protein [Thiohalocapsa halophila]|uniref:PIN domain-containing protein n=1 Tax=Thiohalocapsa halophila TaxID=69359 RepID=UPI002ADD518B|nr:PIN domain-containing protein [Thiohalocapsa halophila]
MRDGCGIRAAGRSRARRFRCGARSHQHTSLRTASTICDCFTLLACVPLLLEYEAVLKRPEHLRIGGRTEAMTDAFLDALCLRCGPLQLFYLWRPRTRDQADDMVLETALSGQADHSVTLNTADFAAAAQFRSTVLTPTSLPTSS